MDPTVTLQLGVDRSSPVPLYFQLSQQLEAAIERGALTPGSLLGNEIELAGRLGLSRPAPRDAAHLGDWAALARATGWWWPGEEVCVLVERPARIGPVALPDHPLAAPVRATVEYRDGAVFS